MSGRPWASEDLRQLRALYPDRPTRHVAEELRRPIASVYNMAAKQGLHKSAAFRMSPESGILRKGETRPEAVATQFKKGQVPANKGMRRPGWAPGRMAETQFRKGQLSGRAAKNWKPIGTILPDSDGYLRIKVRDAMHGKEPTGFGNSQVWPFLSRYIWAQHNGPIPPKHTIVYKDRNRKNCAIENLECVHRSELARRNGMWNLYPRELAVAIQLNGALKRKLRRLEEQGNGKK